MRKGVELITEHLTRLDCFTTFRIFSNIVFLTTMGSIHVFFSVSFVAAVLEVIQSEHIRKLSKNISIAANTNPYYLRV